MPTSPQPSRSEKVVGRGFVYLMLSFVLLIVVYPLLESGLIGRTMMLVLHTATLIAGVYAVRIDRRHLIIATAICVPQVVFAFWNYILGSEQALVPATILTIVFYAYVLVQILTYVIHGRRVTSDRIFGALTVYLLIGALWGAGYLLLHALLPGSFAVDLAHDPDGVLDYKDFTYFSYVTLTTVGYGGITPVGPQARSMAILESIGGQFYIAVLVARLVGLYSPGESEEAGNRLPSTEEGGG